MTSNAVISALEQQVSGYQRLAKLAELQHEFVQQSQTEELLDLLGRRAQVLDEINRLEATVAPARKQWGDYVQQLSADDRTTAEGLMKQTRELLEAITLADRNDTMVLQQRKLNLGKQINQATAARQVNRTYATAAYGPRKSRMDFQQ